MIYSLLKYRILLASSYTTLILSKSLFLITELIDFSKKLKFIGLSILTLPVIIQAFDLGYNNMDNLSY
jgi:hypothetical protein